MTISNTNHSTDHRSRRGSARGGRWAAAIAAGAAAVLAVGVATPAQAASETTTRVTKAGQYTSNLTYPVVDGSSISFAVYSNWSSVSAKSAHLDSVRVCVGKLPGGSPNFISPTVTTYHPGANKDHGTKDIPAAGCNTYSVNRTLTTYDGNVRGQVGLTWVALPFGGEGAQSVFAQYNS